MKTKQHILVSVALLFFSFCLPLSFVKAVSCPTAQSGDITINTNCTFDGTNDGAVGGNITIGAGFTMTILAGQTIAVTQGKSFVITALGAKITIISTGTMALGKVICLTDGDNDTYPASLAASTQTLAASSCPAGKILRSTAKWLVDCNDASATYLSNLLCYANADGDGQYSTVQQSVCGTATTCAGLTPPQSATPGTDCCDTDANAYFGQTQYFATTRTTCGGYDYDCVGGEVLDSTGIQAATYACTNPCGGCALNYGATAGWLTAPPATCGGTGTLYSMAGGYTSGTCYNVASCATLVTGNASAKRGCH